VLITPSENRLKDLKSIVQDQYTLLLGKERSTSSFVLPLHQLFKLGLIDEPNLEAATNAFNVEINLKHEEIRSRIANAGNKKILGATWDNGKLGSNCLSTDCDTRVTVLNRYELVPNDIIAITSDLEDHRSMIERFVFNHGQALALDVAGLERFVPIQEEHLNAHIALKKWDDQVKNKEESEPLPPIIETMIKWAHKDWFVLLFHCFIVVLACRVARVNSPGMYYSLTGKSADHVTTKQLKQLASLDATMAVISSYAVTGLIQLPFKFNFDTYHFHEILLSILFGIVVSAVPFTEYLQRLGVGMVKGTKTGVSEMLDREKPTTG